MTKRNNTTWLTRLPAIAAVGAFTAAVALTAMSAQAAWDTEWSEKLGVTLEAQFDSSGPDIWDPKAHPTVFIVSEGPGYGGLLSGVTLPGFAIFDADSREVVYSNSYDVLSMGWKSVFEPHGLGVSAEGQWVYIPTGEGSFGTVGGGRLLIVNARTGKLDKILKLQSNPHHAKSYRDGNGVSRVLVESFGNTRQPTFALDPNDDNKVVGGISFKDLGIGTYLWFVSPDGTEAIAGGRLPSRPNLDPARMVVHDTAMVRVNLMDWTRIGYIPVNDSNVIWTTFTADGKFAYFSGGHQSQLFKYDREQDKIVTFARAGVEGPYGAHVGWSDEEIWLVGKGESSHNRGKVLGLVEAKVMPLRHRPTDQFTTNCIRADHATLHPDPDANEFWITCNSSFEIVIFDIDQRKVSARIPMPNGGSTHSGAFVNYDGWNGEVTSNHNGLQGSALATKKKLLGLN